MTQSTDPDFKQGKLFKAAIPIAIILLSVVIAYHLATSAEQPGRVQASKSAQLVTTVTVAPDTHEIRLHGFGQVQALNEYRITAQVSGPAIYENENLHIGGMIQEGEIMLRIEPDAYQYRVAQENASLVRAEFALKEEKGRQIVAKREWELLDNRLKVDGLQRDLALRNAHLIEKSAAVESAKAAVKLAQLNLERTKIKAPCDGRILRENVAVGQVINAGTEIARFICTDRYEVMINIPQMRLPVLSAIINRTEPVFAAIEGRPARIAGILPDLDPVSKMLRVRLEIDQPTELTRQSPTPLLIGSHVEAVIPSGSVKNSYMIPERALRERNLVWLVDNNQRLRILQANVINRQQDKILITLPDLEQADTVQVILSTIVYPYEGMPVKAEQQGIAEDLAQL